MNVRELREWAESLPEEFVEFPVVLGEAFEMQGQIVIESDDKTMTSASLDDENKEAVLVHDPNADAWTLGRLKAWLKGLPVEAGHYDCVHGESSVLYEYSVRLDRPITTLDVDEEIRRVLVAFEKKVGEE